MGSVVSPPSPLSPPARPSPRSLLLLLVSLAACTGCGVFSTMEVRPLATGYQKPSNVAAYVAVTDGSEPVTDLGAENFRIYENEQLVPSEQTQLKLLDRKLVAAHHVLLLVDMSGADSAEARSVAIRAVLGFVEKLAPTQSVSVLAFDGRAELLPLAEVARGQKLTDVAGLASFKSTDRSRNLNGAVITALGKLSERVARSGKVVKAGTLVVFTRGPDVAGRADQNTLKDALYETPHDVIAIGVGAQTNALADLGRRGLVLSQSAETLPIAFEEAASKAQRALEKHYLISYCSPARRGPRQLRVEVEYTTREGEKHKADFETEIDAKGFRPGCSPDHLPPLRAQPNPDEASPAKDERESTTEGSAAEPGKGTADEPPPTQEGETGPEDAPVAPPDRPGYAK